MNARTVVIGGGVNALVAAHVLSRGGRSVLVVSGRTLQDETGWVPPAVIRELDLEKHGLRIERPDPWVAAPLPDGGRLELWCDLARSVEAIRCLSESDARRWPAFCERMARLAEFLQLLYAAPAPDPLSARFALRARRLGRQGLTDLLRTLPMSVADLLDDWFESDALKGVLGAAGVMRLRQGPRSGGTAFRLLHQHVGSPAGVFRAPHSNIAQVLAALPGVEFRAAANVAAIGVKAGRVASVVLEGGEEIPASLVVSEGDPRRTLLELIDPGWLDPELVRALGHIRVRGVVARLALQLDRAPGFAILALAPSLDYLERAYDDVKHGRVSGQPSIEARASGPNGINVDVQYVPHSFDGTGELAGRVLKMLQPHLGGANVREQRWLLPQEFEPCAELTLDQALWRRPLPELAGYRTPVKGLWLCGPSMHPGDGIAGAAGYVCAREILRQRAHRE